MNASASVRQTMTERPSQFNMGVIDIGLCSLLLSRKPAMLWQTQDLARLLAQDPHWQAPENIAGITGVQIDSRQIQKGDLFIPLAPPISARDGHQFIDAALASGANLTLSAQRSGPPASSAGFKHPAGAPNAGARRAPPTIQRCRNHRHYRQQRQNHPQNLAAAYPNGVWPHPRL